MNEMSLTIELVNGILQYLGSRPFVEVAGLITEIQKQAAAQGNLPTNVQAEKPEGKQEG